MSETDRPRLRNRLGAVALLFGASWFYFWQLRHPVIRFHLPVVNEFLGLAGGLCLPWLTAAAIFCLGRSWSKAVALLAVIPLLIYTGLFLLAAVLLGFPSNNGRDLSFDLFAEKQWKGSTVRFYRTDRGALSDVGVVIRQERTLFPGVLLVRRLGDFYPCRSLEAESTDAGITIKADQLGCPGLHEQPRDYLLKQFVYF